MKNGLSKKTNLNNDIAKKGAVNLGTGPFTKKIGNNHVVRASSGAAHPNPGGVHGAKSLPNGWKKGKV